MWVSWARGAWFLMGNMSPPFIPYILYHVFCKSQINLEICQ